MHITPEILTLIAIIISLIALVRTTVRDSKKGSVTVAVDINTLKMILSQLQQSVESLDKSVKELLNNHTEMSSKIAAAEATVKTNSARMSALEKYVGKLVAPNTSGFSRRSYDEDFEGKREE